MPSKGKIRCRWIHVLGLLLMGWILFPADTYAITDTLKYLEAEKRLHAYPQPVKAIILANLCEIYYPDSMQKVYKYANEILTRFGDRNRKPFTSAQAVAQFTLGLYYFDEKNYSEALDNFFKAEDYFNNNNYKGHAQVLYYHIGVIYLFNKDLINAHHYLHLSNNLAMKQEENMISRSNGLHSLSDLYIEKLDFDSARYYNEQYLEIAKELFPANLPFGHLVNARILNFEKRYAESNVEAQIALSYIVPGTQEAIAFKLYLLMALNYSYLNDNEQAFYYMNKAGYFFDHENLQLSPSGYYMVAGNIYNNLQDYEKAKEFYLLEIKDKNAVIEQKNSFIQTNLHKQYFIYQQNKKINLLEENNLLKEESLKRNRILLYGLTSLAALLIATSGIIIFMQREKYRNRRIISAQRAELTRKQYLEELHEAEMKAATGQIQGQERERERLAKELHDSIGGTLAGIKMELESFQIRQKPNKHLQQITSIVESTYNEVRAISHNFAIPDLIHGDFQDNLKNMIYNIPGKNGLQIKLSVYQDIKWEQIQTKIKTELYRIIQESVANIIKHAEAKKAEIQIVEDGDRLNITIEDDGKGFNISDFKKGLGIRNIRSRIDVMNGTFDLDSSPESGTFLYFNIPITSN